MTMSTDPTPSPAENAEAGVGQQETPTEAPQEVLVPQQLLDEANQKLEQSNQRLRAVSKAYKDLQDEMNAFRSRLEEQSKVERARRAVDAVKTFFDPVQNLRRSLDQPVSETSQLVDGLKLVLHQFQQGLINLGLEEIPGVGSRFDPVLHEAIAIQPTTEKELDGRVVTVYTVGYLVTGKVLQPAQVVVGKYEEPGPIEA